MLTGDRRYLIKKPSVKAEEHDHIPYPQTTTFRDGFEGLSDLDNEIARREHD